MKAFLIMIICLLFSNSVFAMPIVVTGTGTTENQALHDAFLNAIDKRVGTVIEGKSIVEDYILQLQSVKSSAAGYVTNYNIIHKSKDKDRIYLTVSVDVSKDIDIKALQMTKKKMVQSKGDPRIWIQGLDQFDSFVFRSFKNNGFNRLSLTNGDIIAKLELVNPWVGPSGVVACRYSAIIPVKMTVYDKNNDLLFCGSYTGRQLGINPLDAQGCAIEDALNHIVKDLYMDLSEYVQDPVNRLTVYVYGYNNAAMLLQNLPGVTGVYPKNDNLIDVDFCGTPYEFRSLLTFADCEWNGNVFVIK